MKTTLEVMGMSKQQGEGPSEEEIDKLFDDNCYPDDFGTCLMIKEEFRDAVYIALARWGNQPAPPN